MLNMKHNGAVVPAFLFTLDNDGKFSMADYYIYGYGTMNDNISSGN